VETSTSNSKCNTVNASGKSIFVLEGILGIDLDEGTTEDEDEHGDGEDDVDAGPWDTLRVELRHVVVFVLNAITRRNLHDDDLVGKPENPPRKS
jgi:hypothetical protein